MISFGRLAYTSLAATLLADAANQVYTDRMITSSETWKASDTHLLNGQVHVMEGATLTIEPGTTVQAKYTPAGSNSTTNQAGVATATHAATLIVRPGGKIVAEGTAALPITFTSERTFPPNAPELGTWGGIIVLGKAPINGCDAKSQDTSSPITAHIEGLTNVSYGGSDAADNSGTMKYLRIWYGGAELGDHNEINGLTLGGVGSGTTISHIEVAYNHDDGLEIFGGTVNIQYVSLLYNRDDQLDLDCGYTGSIQYVFIKESKEEGDRAHEIDSHNEDNAKTPVTNPVLSHVTILGPGTTDDCHREGKKGQLLYINDGAKGTYINYIATYSKLMGQVSSTAGTPIKFHYHHYKVMNVDGFDGGIEIETWDDHCMPAPCSDGHDITKTDTKFSAGLAEGTDLASEPVGSYAGLEEAAYPGAFAPGAASWLDGWSILSEFNKLETGTCEAPVTTGFISFSSRQCVAGMGAFAVAAAAAGM